MQLITRTLVFGGTVTLTWLARCCAEASLCRAFFASAATVLDWTICASLSMFTAWPAVRLPATWPVFAAFGVTATDADAVYDLGATVR